MRTREDILTDAKARIEHLEYFENYAMLKEKQRGDLALMKELVALADVPDINVGKWIPCSERMPNVEQEVLILAKRKWSNGGFKYIVTSAMYEDGNVRENDSIWHWEDIEGDWDEVEDCYIIPEGWWEYRHYNPDDVYNNCVDDEVIAWKPLPAPYKGEHE